MSNAASNARSIATYAIHERTNERTYVEVGHLPGGISLPVTRTTRAGRMDSARFTGGADAPALGGAA